MIDEAGMFARRPGGGGAVELEFLQTFTAAPTATVQTFSGASLGDADADRQIVVFASGVSGSSNPIASITVAGITASIVAQLTNGPVLGGYYTAGIAVASVPTGTTGDIVITYASAQARNFAATYRMVGAGSAHDTATDNTSEPTFSVDVPGGGVAIAGAMALGGSNSATWDGITEDAEANVETASISSASEFFATIEMGLAVSCTFATPSDASAGVCASWGPA